MNFINELINNPVILFYILCGNLVLTIVSIFVGVFCINKYKRLNLRYERFMAKLGNGEKIEEILQEYIEDVIKLKLKDDEFDKELERLENNLRKCVQKVGLVRYNAYNDTGSDLSFTFALMDAEDNGMVVNGLYSRDSSSIFAKPLVKGKTKYNLSAEEIQAIDLAKTNNVPRYK